MDAITTAAAVLGALIVLGSARTTDVVSDATIPRDCCSSNRIAM